MLSLNESFSLTWECYISSDKHMLSSIYFYNVIYFINCWCYYTSLCLVAQSCLTLCNPMDCGPTSWTVAHQAPLSMGILQARILEWVATPSSRGSSQPGDPIQISWIADGFFTVWTTRETHEYWSGSLSFLQGNFLTQELNRGLLNCRQILYQLRSPSNLFFFVYIFKNIPRSKSNLWLSNQNISRNFLCQKKF